MDRRQRKTRETIFKAFTELLSKKSFSKITVAEIIELADVGRATFYSHFETKDFLLKELCAELFAHVFEAEQGNVNTHSHIFDCEAPDGVFLHLLQHLQKNDNNILDLFSCEDSELFFGYFKLNLHRLVSDHVSLFEARRSPELPLSFWINHIASTFTETVRWWIDNKMKDTPKTVAKYFFLAV